MSLPDPADPQRLIDLELLVTHLQRDLEALHAVLLEQQQEIVALRRLLTRVETRVDRLTEEDEPRDPLLERPPHY